MNNQTKSPYLSGRQMNNGKFIFSQIIRVLPKRTFDCIVEKYLSNLHVKHFYCILLMLCSGTIVAQETVLVTNELNPFHKEVYYVLKSDQSVKHGSYQERIKKELRISGFYKNGKKDSLWTEYYSADKMKTRGMYTQGKPSGIWEYYDYDGTLDQKYDISTKEIVFYKTNQSIKDIEFKVFSKTDTTKTKLERPPLYRGGESIPLRYMRDNLRYPKNAMNNGVTGTVLIAFTIDTDGMTSNYRIAKGIGAGCDEEALRVVKLIPNNWVPGVLNGVPVAVEFVMPVTYVRH